MYSNIYFLYWGGYMLYGVSRAFFSMCAFVLTLSCVIYSIGRNKNGKRQSKMFLAILINVAISSLCAVASDIFQDPGASFHESAHGILLLSNEIYFVMHSALAPMFVVYIIIVNGLAINRSVKKFLHLFIPFIIVEIIVVLNPITEVIFRIDEYNRFCRGPWEVLIYAMACFYMLLGFYYIFRYREALVSDQRHALWYFYIIALAGIIIQLLAPILEVELFAESVALMGVMLSIENDGGLRDPVVDVFNRRAFIIDNTRLLNTSHEYVVASICITNLKLNFRMMSQDTAQEFNKEIIRWIKEQNPKNIVYNINSETFAIISLDSSEKTINQMEEDFRDRFSHRWEFGTMNLFLNSVMHIARIPDDVDSVELITDMVDFKPNVETKGIRIIKGEDLNYITERNNIENYLRDAIENDGFEVFYQPIYGVENDKIEAGEALLRLNIPGVGYIPPDKMIPIAEENGLITDIGNIVLIKVCQFIKRYHPERFGIKYIEVNLSLYQFMAGGIAESFSSILDKFGVDAKMINLEITETAAADGSDSLNRDIERLKSMGFGFSLDDYGTGYSNLSQIINSDFTNIKSDKSLLWDSEKSENSKMVLIDTIKMIRSLDINLIQEGVETQKQLEMVTGAGCNMIQGYYFSKPLEPETFIKYVKSFNVEDHKSGKSDEVNVEEEK